MNNNALLANAITARIAPYLTLTANSTNMNTLKNFDENNNGLHNLSTLGLMSNMGSMNGLNNSMNGNTSMSKTGNEHLEFQESILISKNDLKSTDKLDAKKDEIQFGHLNSSIKASNFNLLYPPSNFNLTSLLKN